MFFLIFNGLFLVIRELFNEKVEFVTSRCQGRLGTFLQTPQSFANVLHDVKTDSQKDNLRFSFDL